MMAQVKVSNEYGSETKMRLQRSWVVPQVEVHRHGHELFPPKRVTPLLQHASTRRIKPGLTRRCMTLSRAERETKWRWSQKRSPCGTALTDARVCRQRTDNGQKVCGEVARCHHMQSIIVVCVTPVIYSGDEKTGRTKNSRSKIASI